MKGTADAIANGQRADEDGAGHRDTQERAEMTARMEAQIGLKQIQMWFQTLKDFRGLSGQKPASNRGGRS
jgi:hypothetical protein